MSNNSSTIDVNNGLDYILLFRLIVWGYMGMVLSLFGIVGNVITILVLISRSMRTTSTNIYLTALSCSNILFLLIFIPSYSMRYLIGYRYYINNRPPFAFELLLLRIPTTPIYNTILLSIIYLTIAVSVDRLILVKLPLKAKQILTPRTTLIAIFSIYIFSIVYCIPYWFEQEYIPQSKQCRLTTIGIKIYKFTHIYIYIPVVYLFPLITLTAINITIIQSLIAKKHRKKSLGAKTTKKNQADHYITLMLVTVIIVFVLSQLPLLILNVWYAIDPETSVENLVFHTLNSIGVLLIVLNTSTNFLLYCFFGQKFRETLIQFILSILSKNNNKQSILQSRIAQIAQNHNHSIINNTHTTRLSERQSQSNTTRPSQIKQRLSLIKSSSTTDLKKTVELINNNNDKSNQHQDDSCPLLTDAKQISFHSNENFPLKSDQSFNLYTCSNGKRVFVLKI